MKIKNIQTSAFLQNLTKAYTEGVYADTPANRKLGRVGMSYAQYAQKVAGRDKGGEQKVEKEDISKKKEKTLSFSDSVKEFNFIKDRLSEFITIENFNAGHGGHGGGGQIKKAHIGELVLRFNSPDKLNKFAGSISVINSQTGEKIGNFYSNSISDLKTLKELINEHLNKSEKRKNSLKEISSISELPEYNKETKSIDKIDLDDKGKISIERYKDSNGNFKYAFTDNIWSNGGGIGVSEEDIVKYYNRYVNGKRGKDLFDESEKLQLPSIDTKEFFDKNPILSETPELKGANWYKSHLDSTNGVTILNGVSKDGVELHFEFYKNGKIKYWGFRKGGNYFYPSNQNTFEKEYNKYIGKQTNEQIKNQKQNPFKS